MIPVVGTAWKVGLFPIWTLWLGYKGLWWAIKPGEPTKNADGHQASASVTPPRGALMGSFLGAMGSSIAMAIGFEWLARTGRFNSEHALWLWAWGTLAVTLAGLLVVRLSARPVRSVGDRMKVSLAKARAKAGRVGDIGLYAVQSAVDAAKVGWRPEPLPAVAVPPDVAVPPAADRASQANVPSRPAPDRAARCVGKAVGGAARCAFNAGAKVAGGGRKAIGNGFVHVGQRLAGRQQAHADSQKMGRQA